MALQYVPVSMDRRARKGDRGLKIKNVFFGVIIELILLVVLRGGVGTTSNGKVVLGKEKDNQRAGEKAKTPKRERREGYPLFISCYDPTDNLILSLSSTVEACPFRQQNPLVHRPAGLLQDTKLFSIGLSHGFLFLFCFSLLIRLVDPYFSISTLPVPL